MSTTTIPEVDLHELLAQNKEAIGESVKRVLLEELKSNLSYSCTQAISDATAAFVKEEIAPALRIYLDEHRAEILSELHKGLAQVFSKAISGMVESAAKNMAQSWNVKKGSLSDVPVKRRQQ